MARLPGLRPSEDRPSFGGSNTGRVQVRNPIGEKGLQPQARPVDTYSRPQQPAQGPSGLAQLAQALAGISPSIQGFIEEDASRRKTEAEDLANRRIGGMSFDEARAAVDSGSMSEMQNPWFKAAFMKQYGERLAYQRQNELSQAYATSPDRTTMNLDQFIASQMQKDIEQYGGNKHFVNAYTPLMQGFNQQAQSTQTQQQTEEIVGEAKQGFFETALGRIDALKANGATPDEIAAALRADFDYNRDALGLSYKDQDAELLRVAQSLAESGNHDLVQAILTNERVAPDGTVLGPLMNNRQFTVDAANIITAAERKTVEAARETAFNQILTYEDRARKGLLTQDEILEFRKANPNVISDAEVSSLINQSNAARDRAIADQASASRRIELENQEILARGELRRQNMQIAGQGRVPFLVSTQLPDANGERQEVSADKQREWLVEDIATTAQRKLQAGEFTPEQAVDYQIANLATSGLVSDQWSNTLTGGFTGANTWNLTADNRPPALDEGAELYMQMHAKAPALLERHIEDASVKRFYETYRVGRQRMSMDHQQALAHATSLTKEAPIDNPLTTIRKEDLETVVKSIGGNNGGWFGSGQANNEAWVAEEIQRSAEEYSLAGTLTGPAALEEAKTNFLNTHTAINGQWVNTSDAIIPQEFEELAKVTLEDFAKANDLEPDEITLRPASNGTGAWEVIYKGAVPMLAGDPASSTVTLEGMYNARINRQNVRIEELKAQQAAGNDAAMEGLKAELLQIDKDLARHDSLTRSDANYRPLMLQPRADLEARKADIQAIMGQ